MRYIRDNINVLEMMQMIKLLGLRLKLKLRLEVKICANTKAYCIRLKDWSLINKIIKPLIV